MIDLICVLPWRHFDVEDRVGAAKVYLQYSYNDLLPWRGLWKYLYLMAFVCIKRLVAFLPQSSS